MEQHLWKLFAWSVMKWLTTLITEKAFNVSLRMTRARGEPGIFSFVFIFSVNGSGLHHLATAPPPPHQVAFKFLEGIQLSERGFEPGPADKLLRCPTGARPVWLTSFWRSPPGLDSGSGARPAAEQLPESKYRQVRRCLEEGQPNTPDHGKDYEQSSS